MPLPGATACSWGWSVSLCSLHYFPSGKSENTMRPLLVWVRTQNHKTEFSIRLQLRIRIQATTMISQLGNNLWPNTTRHKGLSVSNNSGWQEQALSEIGIGPRDHGQKFLCLLLQKKSLQGESWAQGQYDYSCQVTPNISRGKTDRENIFVTFYIAGDIRKGEWG